MSDKSKDYAVLGPETEHGRVAIIANDSEKRIEVGEFRAIPQGKPLNLLGGDAVRLTPRDGTPVLDIEYVYKNKQIESSGPSTAATEAYRDGWDSIWNKSIDQTSN